jgi:phosphopantetheine adenylyltransferase
MEERRKYPRYICSKDRKFVAVYENTDRLIGEVRDFSRQGMCFSSPDPLREKEDIKIVLQMSGLKNKIPATIEIVWVKPQSSISVYGARLVKISPASKFDIMDLLYHDWKKQKDKKVK